MYEGHWLAGTSMRVTLIGGCIEPGVVFILLRATSTST